MNALRPSAFIGSLALQLLSSPALVAQNRDTSMVIIRAGRLIDGVSDNAASDQAIVVSGGRIQSVGPWARTQRPAGARVIDLSNATVLPGLIDNHTHLLLQGDITTADYNEQLLEQSIPYRAILGARNAQRALMQGFTALRDVETEGAMYADVDIKRAINRGEIPGPRLWVSTRAMAPTGAYGITTPNWELRLPTGVQIVDGADNIRQAVREQVRNGADLIKFYADRAWAPTASCTASPTIRWRKRAPWWTKRTGCAARWRRTPSATRGWRSPCKPAPTPSSTAWASRRRSPGAWRSRASSGARRCTSASTWRRAARRPATRSG